MVESPPVESPPSVRTHTPQYSQRHFHYLPPFLAICFFSIPSFSTLQVSLLSTHPFPCCLRLHTRPRLSIPPACLCAFRFFLLCLRLFVFLYCVLFLLSIFSTFYFNFRLPLASLSGCSCLSLSCIAPAHFLAAHFLAFVAALLELLAVPLNQSDCLATSQLSSSWSPSSSKQRGAAVDALSSPASSSSTSTESSPQRQVSGHSYSTARSSQQNCSWVGCSLLCLGVHVCAVL